MWLEPKYYPIRIAVLVTVAVMLFVFVQTTHAKDKTFPLNEAIPEQFVACLDQADAEKIIKTDVNDHEKLQEVVDEMAMGRKCLQIRTMVTYKKLILRLTKDGVKYSVYEAEVAGTQLFVPMKGWAAKGEVTL